MKLIKKRINELEVMALEAEFNNEPIDAIKYNFAAMELHKLNHQLLTQAIDQSIENLKPNNIVTKP